MKRSIIVAIIFSIAVTTLFVMIYLVTSFTKAEMVNNKEETASNRINMSGSAAVYKNFLHGTESVEIGNNLYTLEKLASEYSSERNEIKYALFDMNGDNIPELHIRTERFYDILTYRNNELMLWQEESIYSKPLNTQGILYERSGSAPKHITYIYGVKDYFGKTLLEVRFEKYASSGGDYDTFYFNDVEVSKEIWDALTMPYLSSKSDLIKWFDISEEIK